MTYYIYGQNGRFSHMVSNVPRGTIPARSTTKEPISQTCVYNVFADEWVEVPEQAPIVEPFSYRINEKLKALNDFVNAQFTAYLSKYPEVEIESFKTKAAEANLVMADENTPLVATPYLSALTQNVLSARNQLAQDVYAKVVENASLEAFAVGTRDAIKACETQEALDAIVW